MDAYARISRYKAHLMGIAILIVVYGHLLYYHSGLQNYEDLHFTEWYSLCSVEIFMLVSGFGVFQSLHKDRNASSFYVRRLRRLLPAYLPVMIVWCGFNLLTGRMQISEAVGNLTAMGWWFQTGHQFNWYVPALLVLYLLSPLFYDAIQHKKTGWTFAVLILLNVAGWHSQLLLALSRFPTYFLGMYFGAQFAEGKLLRRRTQMIWFVVGILALLLVPYFFLIGRKYLWYYGMYWNLFVVSVPFVVFILTRLLSFGEKSAVGRAVNHVWGFLGNRSFEIYLCHLALNDCCLKLGVHSWRNWILISLCGIGIGIAFHEVVALCQSSWAALKLKKQEGQR